MEWKRRRIGGPRRGTRLLGAREQMDRAAAGRCLTAKLENAVVLGTTAAMHVDSIIMGRERERDMTLGEGGRPGWNTENLCVVVCCSLKERVQLVRSTRLRTRRDRFGELRALSRVSEVRVGGTFSGQGVASCFRGVRKQAGSNRGPRHRHPSRRNETQDDTEKFLGKGGSFREYLHCTPPIP